MTSRPQPLVTDEHALWLRQQFTAKIIAQISEARMSKLTNASIQSQNVGIDTLQIRLLLNQASELEKVLNLLNLGEPIK